VQAVDHVASLPAEERTATATASGNAVQSSKPFTVSSVAVLGSTVQNQTSRSSCSKRRTYLERVSAAFQCDAALPWKLAGLQPVANA